MQERKSIHYYVNTILFVTFLQYTVHFLHCQCTVEDRRFTARAVSGIVWRTRGHTHAHCTKRMPNRPESSVLLYYSLDMAVEIRLQWLVMRKVDPCLATLFYRRRGVYISIIHKLFSLSVI